MPRKLDTLTVETILAVHKAQPDRIAPALGAEMLHANIPVVGIAALLRVTPPTALRWMRGDATPREVYHRSIRKLTAIIRKAKKEKATPLVGTYQERMQKLQELVATFKAAGSD